MKPLASQDYFHKEPVEECVCIIIFVSSGPTYANLNYVVWYSLFVLKVLLHTNQPPTNSHLVLTETECVCTVQWGNWVHYIKRCSMSA